MTAYRVRLTDRPQAGDLYFLRDATGASLKGEFRLGPSGDYVIDEARETAAPICSAAAVTGLWVPGPARWSRNLPGLYVDPTETFVVSREEDSRPWYSIRAFWGYGPSLSGWRVADYGSIFYGDFGLLSDAKAEVERLVEAGFVPGDQP